MTLPNFVVIGAMKAGTVSLGHYLDEHPNVFLGRGRRFSEPNFFIAEHNWPRGRGWYESLFAGADPAAVDLDKRLEDHRSIDKPVPRLHDLTWLPRREVKLDPRWRPDQRTGLARLLTTRRARAGNG
jgi:hypothetical protein